MTDLVFKGKVSISDDKEQAFLEDFQHLLTSYKAIFTGNVRSYGFEEAEIITDETMND